MAFRVVKLRRQRPVRGGRTPATGGFTPALWKWIDKEARRYNCSRSFVLAVCVGEVAGIDVERYDEPPPVVVEPPAETQPQKRLRHEATAMLGTARQPRA